MARRDYFNDPNAPAANSVVASVVAAVRNDDGDLLLIHRTDNDRWALPGGGHDIGESISDTVVREVREETGIDVKATGLTAFPQEVGIAPDVLAAADLTTGPQGQLMTFGEPRTFGTRSDLVV